MKITHIEVRLHVQTDDGHCRTIGEHLKLEDEATITDETEAAQIASSWCDRIEMALNPDDQE